MTLFIVCYDVNKDSKAKYSDLDKKIEALGGIRLQGSTWVVNSKRNISEMYLYFEDIFDHEIDSLFIAEISGKPVGFNSPET